MIYFFIAQLFSLLLDLGTVGRHSHRHKDLQILLLRQQLRILQRQHPTDAPCFSLQNSSPWRCWRISLRN